jgi:uncharacterized membrane protein YgdD (TMEM256/DUF423 family)
MRTSDWHHTLQLAPAPETLDDRIVAFAALVGLILVLLTLFTSQRNSHIQELSAGTPDRRDWTTEIWLNAVVAVFTISLFVAGMPTFIASAEHLDVLRIDGSLELAYVLVWLLLIGLVFWQGSLVQAALKERGAWDKRRAPSGGKHAD